MASCNSVGGRAKYDQIERLMHSDDHINSRKEREYLCRQY